MELQIDRYIPPGFEDEFVAHIMTNIAKAERPSLTANPILAIAGPAGTGKTSNSYAIAEAMGCKVYPVQGKDLVAQLEGQASALIIKALLDASKDETSLIPIVFLDDADLGGLGTSPNVTGTVNGEAVKGCVMGWADNPKTVTVDDGDAPPRAIPLRRRACMVLTTNRLDHLHEPMLREGRSSVVELDPQGRDLQNVIAGIFPNLGLRLAGNLMRKFPNQRISFFASLKGAVAKRNAVEQAKAHRGSLRSINWKAFADHLERVSEGASYQDLVTEGEKIAAQSRDANFVKKAKPTSSEAHSPIAEYAFYGDGNGVFHPANDTQPKPHVPPMKN